MSANRWVHALLGLALLLTVLGQSRPVAGYLRYWLNAALTTEPEALRARFNPEYAKAVLIADQVGLVLPWDVPVLVGLDGPEPWFVALELQPRRVFRDRPAKRRHFKVRHQSFQVLRFEGSGDHLLWSVEEVGGPKIFSDGFEQGLEAWSIEPQPAEGR